MENNGSKIARCGFVLLAASAGASFFIKPSLVDAFIPDKTYLVSVGTIGYGYLWHKEAEGDPEFMGLFEPDEAEIQREELEPGSVLRFSQDPDLDKDVPWLEVVSEDGEELCDIPWRATPEEEAAVMLIVDKINEGRDVWAEVTSAAHDTIDAGPDNARIHDLEFDVFYR